MLLRFLDVEMSFVALSQLGSNSIVLGLPSDDVAGGLIRGKVVENRDNMPSPHLASKAWMLPPNKVTCARKVWEGDIEGVGDVITTMVVEVDCHGAMNEGERLGSGDGERRTLLTRQMAFEPLLSWAASKSQGDHLTKTSPF